MISGFEFVAVLLGLLAVWGAYSLRHVNLREYFSGRTGRGILKGVILAVVFSLVMVGLSLLTGCTGTYFNDAAVYAGLDYTKKLSPQCKHGGPDDHTTSNLGLRGGLYRSDDKKFDINVKYTHHSCAFSPDAASYDAVGVELEYKLWER